MSDETYILTRRERAGLAWRGVWPLLAAAFLLLAFALWQDARFPTRFMPEAPEPPPEYVAALRARAIPNPLGWADWGIFFGVAWFLLFKGNVMFRRLQLRPIDWLAISLILTNAAFSALYQYALAGGMFPLWFATHHDAVFWLLNALRVALFVTVVASAALLITIPEPDRVRHPWIHERLAPLLVAVSLALLIVALVDPWGNGDPCTVHFDSSRDTSASVTMDANGECTTEVIP